MRISQKRIKTIKKYLTGLNENDSFYVGLTNTNDFIKQLLKIGFTNDLSVGEQVLPAVVGKQTKFNAEGGYKIRRDLPKEIVFRDAEIKDWHGHYHSVKIPYRRYPREEILAPSIELKIVLNAVNQKIVTSPLQTNENNPSNEIEIKNLINLFLEIFEECEILQDNLLPTFNTTVTRLNWDILPKGNYPWPVISKTVDSLIGHFSQRRQQIVQARVLTISSFNPDFFAIGKAGFHGYMIFGFSQKNLYVLESSYTGNATYVFNQDWEALAQMTKAEIINGNLQLHRFIHNDVWIEEITGLLS